MTLGENTVDLLVMVRVSSNVSVDVTEPREDQPTMAVAVLSQVVS